MLDGHIVAFFRDIVSGNTSPTITVIYDWWDLKDLPVLSQHTAASKVTMLRPEEHSITKAAAVVKRSCIQHACISPLTLAHPMLTAPYLSPDIAYTLLLEISTAWNWDAPLAPLMRYLRASLYQTCPGVKSLLPFDMADHITASHQISEAAGTSHSHRAYHTSPDLYCAPSTRSYPSIARQEEKPGRTLGPAGLFTIQAR